MCFLGRSFCFKLLLHKTFMTLKKKSETEVVFIIAWRLFKIAIVDTVYQEFLPLTCSDRCWTGPGFELAESQAVIVQLPSHPVWQTFADVLHRVSRQGLIQVNSLKKVKGKKRQKVLRNFLWKSAVSFLFVQLVTYIPLINCISMDLETITI